MRTLNGLSQVLMRVPLLKSLKLGGIEFFENFGPEVNFSMLNKLTISVLDMRFLEFINASNFSEISFYNNFLNRYPLNTEAMIFCFLLDNEHVENSGYMENLRRFLISQASTLTTLEVELYYNENLQAQIIFFLNRHTLICILPRSSLSTPSSYLWYRQTQDM